MKELPMSDWLPPLLAAMTFTSLGLCKVYGWIHGVIGGGGKPALCRLQGRCPSWSKSFNIVFMIMLLCIGALNFALLTSILVK